MTLFLVILLVIFVSTIGCVLVKIAQKCQKPPPPDELVRIRQQIVEEALAGTQASNPGKVVRVESADSSLAFAPLEKTLAPTTIYRSTNLVDWEWMADVPAGETWLDTQPPPNQAFYMLKTKLQ